MGVDFGYDGLGWVGARRDLDLRLYRDRDSGRYEARAWVGRSDVKREQAVQGS